MRIVQLANFHSPTSGGLRTALAALRDGYLSAGCEVHLVVPGPASRTTTRGGALVHEVAAPELPGNRGYRVIVAWDRVRGLLSGIAPDVVEVSDRTTLVRAGSAARRLGARSTLLLHERLDNQARALFPPVLPRRRLVDRWNRRTASQFDQVVATSRYGAWEMERVGVPDVRIIPLGVDLDVFTPTGRSRGGGRPVVVLLGRLSPEKRPETAFEALRVLAGAGMDVEMVVAGDGPLKDHLMAAYSDLPVTFVGFLSDRSRVSDLLRNAAATIHPCPGECFGLSALESMACGTPAVVAANSGSAELVAGGGGLAVPPEPRGFARALELVLAAGPRLSAEARSIAEGYPWSRTVEAMLAVHSGPVPVS